MKIGKIIIILLIIFLLTSPIISSLKITTEDYDINQESNLDSKIQQIIDKINETLVTEYMKYLTFEIGCRYTGTYGCEKAAEYIYNQFESMELETKYHDWSDWGNQRHPYFFESQNVEGTLIGTDSNCDDIIIFNAHYDTVEGTVGAVDDGTGTAGVLAAAYVLSQFDFRRTMKFVTFSGEEVGLRGSQAYAREIYDQGTDILVEFNADMIGYAETEESGRAMDVTYTGDSEWIADTMINISENYDLNFIFNKYEIDSLRKHGWSDYHSFMELGYEIFCCWEYDRFQYYHEPEDTFDKVNISYLVNMTRHIAATMAVLADMDLEYPQIKIASPARGRVLINDILYKKYDYIKSIIFDELNIYAEVKPGANPIEKVEFYYDDKLLFTDEEKPYEYILNKRSIRTHIIKVIAYDTEGNTATDEMRILFINLLKIRIRELDLF
jgi:hypothetical protein